jgi:hypothetical protein
MDELKSETGMEKSDTRAEQSELSGNNGLAQCPTCKQATFKIENGCNTCMNEECGYGKCDV